MVKDDGLIDVANRRSFYASSFSMLSMLIGVVSLFTKSRYVNHTQHAFFHISGMGLRGLLHQISIGSFSTVTKSKIDGISWEEQLATSWFGCIVSAVAFPPIILYYWFFVDVPQEIPVHHYQISMLVSVFIVLFELYLKNLNLMIHYSKSTLLKPFAFFLAHAAVSLTQNLLLVYFGGNQYFFLIFFLGNIIVTLIEHSIILFAIFCLKTKKERLQEGYPKSLSDYKPDFKLMKNAYSNKDIQKIILTESSSWIIGIGLNFANSFIDHLNTTQNPFTSFYIIALSFFQRFNLAIIGSQILGIEFIINSRTTRGQSIENKAEILAEMKDLFLFASMILIVLYNNSHLIFEIVYRGKEFNSHLPRMFCLLISSELMAIFNHFLSIIYGAFADSEYMLFMTKLETIANVLMIAVRYLIVTNITEYYVHVLTNVISMSMFIVLRIPIASKAFSISLTKLVMNFIPKWKTSAGLIAFFMALRMFENKIIDQGLSIQALFHHAVASAFTGVCFLAFLYKVEREFIDTWIHKFKSLKSKL